MDAVPPSGRNTRDVTGNDSIGTRQLPLAQPGTHSAQGVSSTIAFPCVKSAVRQQVDIVRLPNRCRSPDRHQ